MAWTNPHYDRSKAHHAPEGFRNLEPDTREPGGLQRWRKERKEQGLPRPPTEGYDAFVRRWWQRADVGGTDDAAWWLGHATALVRHRGLTVLTDPVLGRRASPVPFAGPARRTPPPVDVAGLPPVDVVLISHNHYDHLDAGTVRALSRRFPQAVFLVPLGLKAWFDRRRIGNVRELDWWASTDVRGAMFTFVPARHWSARTLWDRNRSLWGGWVMAQESFRFWFAGDTGYSDKLAEIGRRAGPIDLAAIPIGAYAPRWFMRGQHVDPAEALRLHREIGCQRSIAIHWGAFELADDQLDEPPRLLGEALAEAGMETDEFMLLSIGGRIAL
ncbi:L-ascorbate metabolism protein UlaG (beta-lactamase superfamily) [Luteibacter jiangsuensis]|uniref:L-ascorbate metabolism protein UlaG (Beta-lactamase superfamily) n=1 Tax=Luteibacter jiangsuensis TaxID=637577 RepID=A0ABT9T379_9GAMM|nr:MBL fold metallo-hydrolase [Luteibacter jiangsuensis]MDQ0010582.1 L-ascorbate metabolism protein UlaG (beta-lactamase superfamily) [Luteibacter jiangsuensis]